MPDAEALSFLHLPRKLVFWVVSFVIPSKLWNLLNRKRTSKIGPGPLLLSRQTFHSPRREVPTSSLRYKWDHLGSQDRNTACNGRLYERSSQQRTYFALSRIGFAQNHVALLPPMSFRGALSSIHLRSGLPPCDKRHHFGLTNTAPVAISGPSKAPSFYASLLSVSECPFQLCILQIVHLKLGREIGCSPWFSLDVFKVRRLLFLGRASRIDLSPTLSEHHIIYPI